MNNFLETLKQKKILVSDGAMGTELQKRGLIPGNCPEEFNITHPEIIKSIYNEYYTAGSDIVTTNSFGANRYRLKFFGYEKKVEEFNEASVRLAKEICPKDKFIAGSIGPLGEIIEPLGTISELDAFNAFAEQAAILENSGVDVIFIETMMALEEISIAVKAVKDKTNLPISASMTFELGKAGLKTPWGVDIKTAVKTLTELGVDIIGSNCGKGFDEMVEVVKEFKSVTNKPIIAQANAGLPEFINGESVYNETAQIIAPKVKNILKAGAKIIGGCCGTNPHHIKKLREIADLFVVDNI